MNSTLINAAKTNEQAINELQVEMDKAVEAAGNAGLSTGQFKQSEWYDDRRQQLAALQARA